MGSEARTDAIKILFLAANPSDTTRLAVDKELREITQRLRATPEAARFTLVQEWAVRVTDLQAALLRHEPSILHFSGHGREVAPGSDQVGGILVEDEAGHAVEIQPAALANLLGIVGGVRCVVLNACHSAAQGAALRQHVDWVVAMGRSIEGAASVAFSLAFYQALGHGRPIETAFQLGKNEIDLSGLRDGDAPVLFVRDAERWLPHNVREALRVIAVTPAGSVSLRRALAARIDAGEVAWLDPMEGPSLRAQGLLERLKRRPTPHVVHFIGRGDLAGGSASLQLDAAGGGDDRSVSAYELAEHLRETLRTTLRLVILERAGDAPIEAFSKAAEILVRAGADAVVVADLGAIPADAARACVAELYGALAGRDRQKGDITFAVDKARAVLGDFKGAAGAAIALYPRGPSGVIFDYSERKIGPRPPPLVRPATAKIDPALARLVDRPFSLVLGDRFKEQRDVLAGFRSQLHKGLLKVDAPASPDLPMSALTQRFALHHRAEKLSREFQRVFPSDERPPPFIDGLARVVCPGVHTTLLRQPWLERALAARRPDQSLYVVQPRDGSMVTLHREASSDDWEELDAPPESFDPEREILLLRIFGGYTPDNVFAQPLLTEDDYAFGLRALERELSLDRSAGIVSALRDRPALILGVSMYTGHHRLVLHHLYPRGVPTRSVAVLDPEKAERALWAKGAGLPGKDEGVETLELSSEDLAAALSGEGAS